MRAPTTLPRCAPEILTNYCVDVLVTPVLSAGLGRSDASSTQPTAAGPGRRASRSDSQSHRTHQSARTLPWSHHPTHLILAPIITTARSVWSGGAVPRTLAHAPRPRPRPRRESSGGACCCCWLGDDCGGLPTIYRPPYPRGVGGSTCATDDAPSASSPGSGSGAGLTCLKRTTGELPKPCSQTPQTTTQPTHQRNVRPCSVTTTLAAAAASAESKGQSTAAIDSSEC
eukprot:COSAG01_NODE_4552_length_4929_cov_144.720083_5_plen_228_part_00